MDDTLHRIADKLFTEVDHLDRVMGDSADLNAEQATFALSVAKRVRRESTLLVRHLAALRDNQLQP